VRNGVHIRTHGSGGTFEPEDIQAMSLAFEEEQWSRFFEQNFYVDKWSLCRD
jgi:hypothetical protein